MCVCVYERMGEPSERISARMCCECKTFGTEHLSIGWISHIRMSKQWQLSIQNWDVIEKNSHRNPNGSHRRSMRNTKIGHNVACGHIHRVPLIALRFRRWGNPDRTEIIAPSFRIPSKLGRSLFVLVATGSQKSNKEMTKMNSATSTQKIAALMLLPFEHTMRDVYVGTWLCVHGCVCVSVYRQ